MRRRTPRVFIGLTEVAGVYTSLQQGLEELGIQTMRVDVAGNPRGYRAPDPMTPSARPRKPAGDRWSTIGSRIERGCADTRRRRSGSKGSARVGFLAAQVAVELGRVAYRLALLARVIAGYDVVVLSGGASFLRGRDLPLLHRLGKRVIVVFTGSDHRPPYLNGKMYRALSTEEIIAETRRIRRFIGLAERYATAIVGLSSSAQLHRQPFVHFLALGLPFAPEDARPRGPQPIFKGTGVRILHSPTDSVSKGTATVRAIIDGLRADGLAIDYMEVIDRPHHEVLAALDDCDFAIDELHSDTPLGRFATEAAWFGKPAVTAGEYARNIKSDLPASLIPPSTFVPPDEVGATVRRFIDDPDHRTLQGRSVEAFVRDQWNPRSVARRFLEIVDGRIPPEWTYDPATLTYVGGWGLDVRDWRLSCAAVIRKGGPASLCLSEALTARLLDQLREASAPPDGYIDTLRAP